MIEWVKNLFGRVSSGFVWLILIVGAVIALVVNSFRQGAASGKRKEVEAAIKEESDEALHKRITKFR